MIDSHELLSFSFQDIASRKLQKKEESLMDAAVIHHLIFLSPEIREDMISEQVSSINADALSGYEYKILACPVLFVFLVET